MVYELRVYRCMPGRKADVLARFRDRSNERGAILQTIRTALLGATDFSPPV